MTTEIVPPSVDGRLAPFRVEVSGTWRDPRERSESARTHVFIVAAPGPSAAQIAAGQLFGREAARGRCVALPERTVRLLEH